MIKFPLILMSTGKQKLYSYEKDGIHTIPIFSNASLGLKYARETTKQLANTPDNFTLQTVLCTSPKQGLDMFRMISIAVPDVRMVVVDPNPPHAKASEIAIIEEKYDIGDFIEILESINNKR